MKEINYSDVIYATLIQRGSVIASLKISGVTSIDLIIKQIKHFTSKCVGLVSIKIRNFTQGWSQCRNIKIDSNREVAVTPVQLSLF